MPSLYKDWDKDLVFTCQAFIRTGIRTSIYMPSLYKDWGKDLVFTYQAFIRTGISVLSQFCKEFCVECKTTRTSR